MKSRRKYRNRTILDKNILKHLIIFIYDVLTNILVMRSDSTTKLIGIIAILVGIIMIIYPPLVGYLVGIFLIAYGILEVIK